MVDMFNFDRRDLDILRDKVERLADKALPIASKATLNRMAFTGQAYAREEIQKNLVLRNKFTAKTIRVEKARGLNVRTQAAVLGATEDYMEKQEFGGSEMSKGKHGLPLPTTSATGEGEGTIPRRRNVRAANRLDRVKLSKARVNAYRKPGGGTYSKRQKVFLRVVQAIDKGFKYVFLDRGGGHKAIYRVTGGRKTKSGERSKLRMKMMYDLSRKSARIPARPWLGPAVDKVSKEGRQYATEALIFQAKRLGLR